MVGLPPEPRFHFWFNCLQTLPRVMREGSRQLPCYLRHTQESIGSRIAPDYLYQALQFRHEPPVYARTKKMSLQKKGLILGLIVSLLLCVVLLGASHKRESEKARNELKRLKINY